MPGAFLIGDERVDAEASRRHANALPYKPRHHPVKVKRRRVVLVGIGGNAQIRRVKPDRGTKSLVLAFRAGRSPSNAQKAVSHLALK